jgi:hypothetical protein
MGIVLMSCFVVEYEVDLSITVLSRTSVTASASCLLAIAMMDEIGMLLLCVKCTFVAFSPIFVVETCYYRSPEGNFNDVPSTFDSHIYLIFPFLLSHDSNNMA